MLLPRHLVTTLDSYLSLSPLLQLTFNNLVQGDNAESLARLFIDHFFEDSLVNVQNTLVQAIQYLLTEKNLDMQKLAPIARIIHRVLYGYLSVHDAIIALRMWIHCGANPHSMFQFPDYPENEHTLLGAAILYERTLPLADILYQEYKSRLRPNETLSLQLLKPESLRFVLMHDDLLGHILPEINKEVESILNDRIDNPEHKLRILKLLLRKWPHMTIDERVADRMKKFLSKPNPNYDTWKNIYRLVCKHSTEGSTHVS